VCWNRPTPELGGLLASDQRKGWRRGGCFVQSPVWTKRVEVEDVAGT
jgi:hypothetical protein